MIVSRCVGGVRWHAQAISSKEVETHGDSTLPAGWSWLRVLVGDLAGGRAAAMRSGSGSYGSFSALRISRLEELCLLQAALVTSLDVGYAAIGHSASTFSHRDAGVLPDAYSCIYVRAVSRGGLPSLPPSPAWVSSH